MAEEEVARFVVGNDSGMCKAGSLGDDARNSFFKGFYIGGRQLLDSFSTKREIKMVRIDRLIALSYFCGWWCVAFLSVKRTSALKVNAHVRLQSTVILRMASFQSTTFFLQHVQRYHPLLVVIFRTVFSIKFF